MTPNELEQRLRNLRSMFPGVDLTPNTFLQLVKPTEELLLPYQRLFQDAGLKLPLARASFLPRILLNVFKSVGVTLIRSGELRSWRKHQINPKGTLVISHFTHAQQCAKEDAFFGDLLSRNSHNVFYLNSTRVKHQKLVEFYPKNESENLVFMTKSLPLLRVLSLHLKYLFSSLILFRHSFYRTNDVIDRWLLVEAAVHQHSRATLANKFFEIRLMEIIETTRPSRVSLTFEGHAHEAVVIQLIHRSFPWIELVPYQHAPVVPEQFGILRNLKLLNAKDKILTSGEITREYFSAFRKDIEIVNAGSSKFKAPLDSFYVGEIIKVIGASEGTIQSLEVFINLFMSLKNQHPTIEFKLRVHPAINDGELRKSLKRLGAEETLISNKTLLQDLSSTTYCIYRSSAVAIEGLALGVTPLYFDQSRSQGLNPLFFANLHLPVFGTAGELASFFDDISQLNPVDHGVNRIELQRISNRYFSQIPTGVKLI
jgi:hypothetical protein